MSYDHNTNKISIELINFIIFILKSMVSPAHKNKIAPSFNQSH